MHVQYPFPFHTWASYNLLKLGAYSGENGSIAIKNFVLFISVPWTVESVILDVVSTSGSRVLQTSMAARNAGASSDALNSDVTNAKLVAREAGLIPRLLTQTTVPDASV